MSLVKGGGTWGEVGRRNGRGVLMDGFLTWLPEGEQDGAPPSEPQSPRVARGGRRRGPGPCLRRIRPWRPGQRRPRPGTPPAAAPRRPWSRPAGSAPGSPPSWWTCALGQSTRPAWEAANGAGGAAGGVGPPQEPATRHAPTPVSRKTGRCWHSCDSSPQNQPPLTCSLAHSALA